MSSNLHRYLDSLNEEDSSLPPSPGSSINGYSPPPQVDNRHRDVPGSNNSRRMSALSDSSYKPQTKREYYPADNYDVRDLDKLFNYALFYKNSFYKNYRGLIFLNLKENLRIMLVLDHQTAIFICI